MSEAAASVQDAPAPVVIKKYANRRLYNTAQSTYVTLEHLADMVRREVAFVVYDARTSDDITRQVLTQIIFEEETRGRNILPVPFLRQLIQLYGGRMQAMAPSYLEASMDAFVRGGEAIREQWMEALAAGVPGKPPAAGLFEEQIRNNLAMFDKAMKMFTPYPLAAEPSQPAADPVAELTRRMEEMQRQLAELAKR